MPFLSDGSYAPSHATISSYKERQAATIDYMNGDNQLHIGYVAAIHYPGDKGYTDSKNVVYDIVAPVTAPGGGVTWMTFFNARCGMVPYGSSADFSRVRLNVPKGWTNGGAFTEAMMNQSSRVVFLCENGRSQASVIVGLAEHPSLFDDSKDWGHYSASSFNGVRTLIDKDGQWSITFTGAILDAKTNAYIEAPEATTGTTILLDKEGSILLDNVKGESLKLDKTAKSVVITARSMKTSITDKDHVTTAKGKITFLAKGNTVLDGQKVYIGKEGSPEPMVLGNKLAAAYQALVDAFLKTPVIGQLGQMPVTISPALVQALMTLVRYGMQGQANPFLSKKGFLE
jgi:hypothetical protein